MPTPSLIPVVRTIRVTTRCSLTEAKPAATAAIAAGLGMPGLTAAALEAAMLENSDLSPVSVHDAAAALLRLYPLTNEASDPLANLRHWLESAGDLGDYALVPLPGRQHGAQLTVLDLRNLLELAEQ